MIYRTDDAICGVYEIVNIANGKKYIGQSINILTRWKDHIKELNKNKSRCTLLQRAWNKYGADNFVFNILKKCNEDDLDYFETHYISLYDTINSGYNIESGGNKQKHLAESTKKKIGDANRGRKASEETRRKMSESQKGEKNPMHGKHHTDETKEKIGMNNKGKTGHPCSEETREICRQANLGKVLSQETKDKIGQANKGNVPHNKDLRKVYFVELNRVFDCVSDAAKELGLHSGCIKSCCEGTRHTCGGYHWRYYEE